MTTDTPCAEYLADLEIPYLLPGDFNDVTGSRTPELLSQGKLAAGKPESDRYTIPSTGPKREIDFIFAGPEKAWQFRSCRVLDARKTSDHRPVLANFDLPD